MLEPCPKCKNKETIDLTKEVESNQDFTLFFKKFIYCPQCDYYIFIGKKMKFTSLNPLTKVQPPPKTGSGAISHN